MDIIAIVLLALIGSWFLMSGLVWIICWAFGILFSWKYVIGAWAICILVSQFGNSLKG